MSDEAAEKVKWLCYFFLSIHKSYSIIFNRNYKKTILFLYLQSNTFLCIDGLRRVIGWDFPVEVLERRAGDPPKLIGDPLSIGVDLGWKANNGLDEILTSAWEGWQAGPRPITVPGA